MANPPGNPNWRKGPDGKGHSGNAGGMTKEQREARDLVRSLLTGDAKKVHDNLIKRIEAGSDLLIKYAHEQLHGKAPDKVDIRDGRADDPFDGMTTEELRALFKKK